MRLKADIQGSKEIQELLEKLPSDLYDVIKPAFQRASFKLQRKMQQRTSNKALKKRTGLLSRSFKTKTTGSSIRNLQGSVETDAKYAPIHEFGGIVRAKNSKYLTIPLDAMKTGAGVTRMTARQAGSLYETFFKTSKKGNLILFKKEPNGGATPLFVLKESVKIDARLGFFDEAEKEFKDLINVLRRLVK